jgi:hypothetical protein
LEQEEWRIANLGGYAEVYSADGLDAIVVSPDAKSFSIAPGDRISPQQEAADRARVRSRYPIVYDVAISPVNLSRG